MDIALSKLLSHVYELEGLLLVADRHGVDTPAVVYDRIREHARALHEMAQLVPGELPQHSEPGPTPEPMRLPVPDPEPEPKLEPLPEPEPELVPEPESEPLPAPMPEPVPAPEPEPAPLPEPEPEPQPMREPEPEPAPLPEPEPEPEPEPRRDFERIPDEDDTPPRSEDDEVRPVFAFPPAAGSNGFSENSGCDAEPLRVDEKLQRTLSKDIRKAFSINDRFRFRRELFEGSEAEFVDAINMIDEILNLSTIFRR